MRQTNGYGRREYNPRTSKRVFIACEGYRSEVRYFEEMDDVRDRLGIDPTLEIIVLNRFVDEAGISDPKRVAELAYEFLLWIRDRRMSAHLYSGMVTRGLGAYDGLGSLRAEVEDRLKGITDPEGLLMDLDRAAEIADGVLEEHGLVDSLTPPESFEFRDGDIMAIVVDRDKSKARSADKYQDFLSFCSSNDLCAYVTNPKFEYWLLMHFEDISQSLANVASSRNKSKAVDNELNRVWGVPKKKRDFSELVLRLDVALRNAKGQPDDPEILEGEAGTSIPRLIEVLKGAR